VAACALSAQLALHLLKARRGYQALQAAASGDDSVVMRSVASAVAGKLVDLIDQALMRDLPAHCLFLHLSVQVVSGRPDGIDASALEAGVAQVVAAVSHEGAPVTGVMLEIASSTGDPVPLQYAVARLVLQLKAANRTLKTAVVVFPPGVMRQEEALARRLAVYADAVGVGYGTGWQRDAEWVRTNSEAVALDIGADSASADDLAAAYLDVSRRPPTPSRHGGPSIRPPSSPPSLQISAC
jgi:hypothetical protein